MGGLDFGGAVSFGRDRERESVLLGEVLYSLFLRLSGLCECTCMIDEIIAL
jgi:hypothetical protein